MCCRSDHDGSHLDADRDTTDICNTYHSGPNTDARRKITDHGLAIRHRLNCTYCSPNSPVHFPFAWTELRSFGAPG